MTRLASSAPLPQISMRPAIVPQEDDCPWAYDHGERPAPPYRGYTAYDPGCPSNLPELELVARRSSDLHSARTCIVRSASKGQPDLPTRIERGCLSRTDDTVDDRGGLHPRRFRMPRADSDSTARTWSGARRSETSPYHEPSFARDGSSPHRGSGRDREALGPQVVYVAQGNSLTTSLGPQRRAGRDELDEGNYKGTLYSAPFQWRPRCRGRSGAGCRRGSPRT